jgi:hypothetical protein
MNTDDLHVHTEREPEKRPRKKKPLPRVPKAIIPIHSSDKRHIEVWDEKRARDLANFPSPFRMLLLGVPNCGKTSTIKNLVMHARPRFQRVYVIHPDIEYSKEYDDLEATDMFSDIPDLKFWCDINEGNYKKTLCILDDLEFEKNAKQRLENLTVLFRYASSHKGISIMLAHQNFFSVPIIVKKLSNIYVCWKPQALNEMAMIENRVGLEAGVMRDLFATVATKPTDSICIDRTRDTPAPVRINIFNRVIIEEDDGVPHSDSPSSS